MTSPSGSPSGPPGSPPGSAARLPPAATLGIRGLGLHLRPWRPGDASAIVRGVADPAYRRWNTPKLLVETEDEALEWVRARALDYENGVGCVLAIARDEPGASAEAIGSVGVGVLDLWMRRGTIGYWVLPEERGRGIARRALTVFTRWAFDEVGLHRLSLGHAVGHEASCRVAKRCGYRYEGAMRGEMFEAGDTSRFRDAHLHARLATDPEPGPVGC
ncbi:GNAT family N-acetyltransferase [Streptomyces montanisoli]|uniref:GNAT family N-acetyltransferase n=1 Tax=Streptomyces montanisoli TaxID=2798581 RepID=A0A940S0M6_9ACTN|nr:GNAT family N-acetyltransferase [Streptomyces montanisoli]MBP0461034.1 GNAT family N-acetyltransferase [Streptomyces montanisoli]